MNPNGCRKQKIIYLHMMNLKQLDMIDGRNRVITQLEKEEFPILNICDVMDWIYTTFDREAWSMSWEWESEKVKEFCVSSCGNIEGASVVWNYWV